MQPKLYKQAEAAGLTTMNDICNIVDTDTSPEYIAEKTNSKLDAAFVSFAATGIFSQKNKDDLVAEELSKEETDSVLVIVDAVIECVLKDKNLTLNAFKIIADSAETKEEAARLSPLVIALVQLN